MKKQPFTYLRGDLETPWGTYAAGLPVPVLDRTDTSVLVELAGLPRAPHHLWISAERVAADSHGLVAACSECGRSTLLGWRRGLCAPCAADLAATAKRRAS